MKTLLAASAAVILSGAAHAADLRAGVAKASITPPASEYPYVVPREKPFVGVHDDTFARALVLDDGATRVVIVSLELTAVPDPEAIARAVADAATVPVANVMVTASHTHNHPLVFYHGAATPSQQRQIDQVRTASIDAVRRAVAGLQPARIGWVRGKAYVNINNGEESAGTKVADPLGSSDKSLDIVRVQSAGRAPIALLLNYANHGEVLFRSVTKDGGYEVSGDLPGAVSRYLEGEKGAPVVLFTSAAEGDQLPLFKSLEPAGTLPGADQGAGAWTLLDVQARRLAAAAIETLARMPAGTADAPISVATGAVTCPGQKFNVERLSGKLLGTTGTAPVTIPLTVFRFGGFALAGVTADIASNIGVAIKKASPVADTTVVTMLAGSVGYVLNDAAYANPGHGAIGSPVKPGCASTAIPAGVARLLGK